MTDQNSVPNFVPLAYVGWLYLVQGIPYGLQDKFIPLQLRSKGLSYSSVSLLKALFVPWATKGLWAPVVEVWGGRQRWLFMSLLALGITAYAGSHVSLENVVSVGCMLLSLNMFSAVQDVAVDGLALQLLPEEQLGLGNTIQVVLYKVGWLLGGAGFTYLVALTDWSMTFIILALIYMLTAILVTVGPANDDDKSQEEDIFLAKDNNVQDDNGGRSQSHRGSRVIEAMSILKDVVYTPGTFWLSIYVFLYKMGERGAVNNMPLFLLDSGMSKEQLAFWNGIVSQGLSIVGSFYGGIILSRKHKSVKDILYSHSLYRFLTILVQFVLIVMWDQNIFTKAENIFIFYAVGILSICFLSYSSGLISTASFTLMMQVSRLCQKKTQASHYSAVASVEITGKLVFAILAGFIIDYAGMASSFALFSVLSMLPLIILRAIPVRFGHTKTE